MANDTDQFIKEVEEDLRREQFERLWERYGVYVIAVAAAVVVGVGGYKYYQRQQQELTARAGETYSSAGYLLELGKHADAVKGFQAVAQVSPSNYANLALLRVVGHKVRQGQIAEAVRDYDQLVEIIRDPILSGYARLQSALLRVDSAGFADIANRLSPLLEANGVWRFAAREAIAVSAFKSGQTVIAKRELEKLIGDPLTPRAIAERSRTLMVLLTEGAIAAAAPSGGAETKPGEMKVWRAPESGGAAPPKQQPVNAPPAQGGASGGAAGSPEEKKK